MVRFRIDNPYSVNLRPQGWKGSVKARHFVMAVQDHFRELQHDLSLKQKDAWSTIQNITTNTSVSPTAGLKTIASISGQVTAARDLLSDEWALKYICVFRVQPLIEAIDDDVSSFITISEINKFTASRPNHWRYEIYLFFHLSCLSHLSSLIRWIAYWTTGELLSCMV
jgi:hypothetical protein